MPHLAFQPYQGDTPSGDGFMRYVLVLQFPAKGLTDYDDLVELENRLEKRLAYQTTIKTRLENELDEKKIIDLYERFIKTMAKDIADSKQELNEEIKELSLMN